MITIEERAEWRTRYALDRTDLYYAQRVRALDALDAAEARAEKAEQERDALADMLSKMNPFLPGRNPEYDNMASWLEWAAQEAAKEGER